MKKSKLEKIGMVFFAVLILIVMYIGFGENSENVVNEIENNRISYEINNVPKYSGEIYVQINNDIPNFSSEDMNIEEDYYSDLENGKVRNGND